ncbi:hypothetical protein ACGFLS_32385 [Streptomyces abikoensis]|uniref:hypothetical protein n=1 Tax=Streptomyces abikoensis TaxID=97398 RepID=UPI00371664DB
MQRYEAEVTIRTAAGEVVTYRGDGLGPADVPGDDLLDGAEAAALAQHPTAQIVSSRVRRG